ncbi:hypothetical protein SODALDRAFT_183100 [Sodiomyces alkalinus F11]|uniref:Uncharacterized protein n=1 Tax=Sodiomyces alkalinus (strain CBS 110278 / VKM F-3762 / F11) TaxID=1314773 RepID=A0A3N2PUJ1_SODAK|nr:hypothetical protein SODALDRAFT_183100 [Sodiomyces alkalinus F11]ROT38162.1 hypothetical protein SODALDRAFT_183100 [Sodiomyces alkalinus F11]
MATTRPDDGNLPEVVPDVSPQALTQEELSARSGLAGAEGKYPYTHDERKEHVSAGLGSDAHKEVVSPISPDAQTPTGDGATAGPSSALGPRICGVKRKTFWVLLAVAVAVVIAVAVGAGVGATRGGKGGGDAQAQEQEPSATSATSSTEASAAPTATSSSTEATSSIPSSTSSAAEPMPTFLNGTVTLPAGDFAFQGFSDVNFTGNYTDIHQAEGFIDFPFDVMSYVWLHSQTGCCINFCQGLNNVTGYRCDPREQPEASGGFNRLYIGCGGDAPREDQNRFCS